MELVVEQAAALDVGKDEVVACIRVPAGGGGQGRGRRRQEVRTYPTFTSGLETLADWSPWLGSGLVVWRAAQESGYSLIVLIAAASSQIPGGGPRPRRLGCH